MIRSILMLTVVLLVAWPAMGDNVGNVPDPKLKKSQFDLPKDIASFKTLRILLLKNEPSVAVGTDGPYGVFDDKGRMLKQGEKLVSVKALAVEEGIQLGSELFRYPSITLISEGGELSVNKRLYRDAVRFWKDADGKLAVNNEINIEDYLKGVLPWEANPKWPVEALKAQAIASRTFALFKAIQHHDDPYDVKSGVLSQVYVGKKIEHRLTNEAIDATRGQILTYRGKIFPGFFHSTCGGATDSVEDVWNLEPNPVLKGVSCEFCRGTKHYRWSARIPESEILAIFHKQGYHFQAIQEIRLGKKDKSGRALFFTVHYKNDKQLRFNSGDFRSWLGPDRFKSTLVDVIEKQGDAFLFRGRGWGHGVGLCQYGMKIMAELGYNTKQILDYYYSGAEIIDTEKDTASF